MVIYPGPPKANVLKSEMETDKFNKFMKTNIFKFIETNLLKFFKDKYSIQADKRKRLFI